MCPLTSVVLVTSVTAPNVSSAFSLLARNLILFVWQLVRYSVSHNLKKKLMVAVYYFTGKFLKKPTEKGIVFSISIQYYIFMHKR